MAKTAKAPQVKEPEAQPAEVQPTESEQPQVEPEPDDGKTVYIVNRAHRVGEPQRWYKPGDTVRLLPCEAQFSLNRGWLRREGDPAPVEKKPPEDKADAEEQPEPEPTDKPSAPATNTKPKE
ncbi:hypothetical protein [Oceanospirillum sediminis]|uniref:Uncharacterized protein n=1 Tax=Oceanospirillum sediminis TaxID=2760088 RepID=A0A839IYC5_9GAMM|nr:hypothetical protein [Oceanospirillum sediminis]MBB1489377.1 hypothetical protein [Oceanospirillum sediminis]